MRIIFKLILILILGIFISKCARTGRPEGGPKDEDAPLFVTSNPPYETTKFKSNEIKLEFDEYVVLKDINKQLVISPPLKNPPLITPQGSPSKKFKIRIIDTLTPNTTYIFNFGNAVQDNNENNILENFKYVFSTGEYIDSLTTSGSVKDAISFKSEKRVNFLLYRLDSSYTDSIIFKKKPNYVASSLDTSLFKFTNLKEGKYFLYALKEKNTDYIFDPITEKIAFLNDTINLPRDSILNEQLILFKEVRPFEFKRAKEISKGKIQFGYHGNPKNLDIKLISKTPDSFKKIEKFEIDKDTLNYWFTPFKTDSLNFIVSNKEFIDTITVRLRKKKIDSLTIDKTNGKELHYRDTFKLATNNPIIKIDTSKILLAFKDSTKINYTSFISKKENTVNFIFKKIPLQVYTFKAYPKAFVDIFETTNDSLNYSFITRELDDYGEIKLNVINEKSKNLIIEVFKGVKQGNLVERQFLNNSKLITYTLLEPGKYTIRAIVDENNNKKWDTGNILLKKQPEKIIYHIVDFNLRANYFVNQEFIIK